MSTPAAKRRRLDNATRTLHKPFKSPFRTPLKPQITEDSSNTSNTPDNADNDFSAPIQPAATPIRSLSTHRIVSASAIRGKTSTAGTRPSAASTLISLRTDIQTLAQAHRLATSTTDADLEVLIERWRAASRAAAEELFASTRDRVNRMGGVGAWREREKEQREWRVKWEKEEIEAERARGEEEGEKEEGGKTEQDDEHEDELEGEREEKLEERNDDDSFTMDMMLRTLNIDLDVIGYDRQGQRWIG